jgi:hypothetical protein
MPAFSYLYRWIPYNSGIRQPALTPSTLFTIGSETTFVSALCVLRRLGYFLCPDISMTFFRSTDFGDLGRYYGQNKAIVGVFNGPVVPFNMGV